MTIYLDQTLIGKAMKKKGETGKWEHAGFANNSRSAFNYGCGSCEIVLRASRK